MLKNLYNYPLIFVMSKPGRCINYHTLDFDHLMKLIIIYHYNTIC
jgi:hypothetical protein